MAGMSVLLLVGEQRYELHGRAAAIAALVAVWSKRINAPEYGELSAHFGPHNVKLDLIESLERRLVDEGEKRT